MENFEVLIIKIATVSGINSSEGKIKNIIEKRGGRIVGNIKNSEPSMAFNMSNGEAIPKKISEVDFEIEKNNNLKIMLDKISSDLKKMKLRHTIYKKEDEQKHGDNIYYGSGIFLKP